MCSKCFQLASKLAKRNARREAFPGSSVAWLFFSCLPLRGGGPRWSDQRRERGESGEEKIVCLDRIRSGSGLWSGFYVLLKRVLIHFPFFNLYDAVLSRHVCAVPKCWISTSSMGTCYENIGKRLVEGENGRIMYHQKDRKMLTIVIKE